MKCKNYIAVFKRIAATALCFMLICQAFCIAAYQSPVSGQPCPLGVGSPVKAVSGKGSVGTKSGKQFLFTALLAGKTQTFYMAFPVFGGIRFRTKPIVGSSSAIFEPEDYYTITSVTSSGRKILTAGDMTVVYTSTADGWTVSFSRYSGETFTLSSDNIIFGYEDSGYRNRIIYSGDLSEDEIIYGSGGRFSGFNLRGKDILLWNTDGYESGDTSADRTLSYANVPIFHSSTGYSLYFNSTYNSIADIGKTDAGKLRVSIDNGDELDMFLWNSSPTENIKSYTALTGKPAAIPKWACDYWIGSTHMVWGDDVHTEEMSAKSLSRLSFVLDKYKELGTMPAALFGEGYPANNKETYEKAASYGVRMLRWNYPGMDPENMSALIDGVDTADLPIIRYADDSSKFYANYIDFTNKNALSLMKSYYSDFIGWGLKGAMLDYGEVIPYYAAAVDGTDGKKLHNLYQLEYSRTLREVFEKSAANGDFILFSRSGCAGSQKYSANFLGDQKSSFEGLKEQLSAMLSMSASGFSNIGGDIGGHFGTPTSELYSRWLQLATFSPIMRTHGGTSLNNTRDPWNYGKEEVFKKYYYIRKNIADCVYSASLKAENTGEPIVKAFAVAFPEQKNLVGVEDQYMFCDSMMVAPIIDSGETTKNVVFPNGKWYNFYNGTIETENGGTKYTESKEDQIPVYLKSGAVIPAELAATLNIGDSFSDADKNTALIVTEPEENSTAVCCGTDGNVTYGLNVETDGYSIVSDKENSVHNLIIYGETPESVYVDGVKIPFVYEQGEGTHFYKDGARTVIRLADDWSKIEIKLSGHSSDEASSTKSWTFPEGAAAEVFGDFSSSFWSSADGYSVYDTVDGNVWQVGEWGNAENKNVCVPNNWDSGAWADNIAALTVKNKSFTNFDITVEVKNVSSSPGGLMISARESTPGQPVPQIGSWDFGNQPDGKANVVFKYFSNDSGCTVSSGNMMAATHSDGVKTNDWNTLRMRVVGNSVRVWLNGVEGKSVSVSDNCNSQGSISVVFSNERCAVRSISLTRLDENGRECDYLERIPIKSAAEFSEIGKTAAKSLSGSYYLAENITLAENETWSIVENFSGVFDGNGHTVTGIDNPLFSSLADSANVKNTVIKGIVLRDGVKGAIAGVTVGNNVKVSNVAVIDGSIAASVGGAFIGSALSGKITLSDCSYTGYVGADYAGGFIGGGGGEKIIKDSYVNITFEAWQAGNNITLDAEPHTERAYFNVGGKRDIDALGFSDDLWLHDGRLPQLKITGAAGYVKGDANHDGAFNIGDLIRIKKYLSYSDKTDISFVAADFGGDRDTDGSIIIDGTDMAALKKYLLNIN